MQIISQLETPLLSSARHQIRYNVEHFDLCNEPLCVWDILAALLLFSFFLLHSDLLAINPISGLI
jgi:hypothetical protein